MFMWLWAIAVAFLIASSPQPAQASLCNDPHCVSCTVTPSFCDACAVGYLPNSGSCVATDGSTVCPAGQWNDGGGCQACDAACVECVSGSANDCTICADGTYRIDTVTASSACGACDASCATCSGPNSNDCVTCPAGWSQFGSGCFPTTSSVTPSSVTIHAPAGGSATQSVTIKSTGSIALAVSSVGITGPSASFFSVTRGTCASLTPTLSPGASCALTVTFSPAVTGNYSAQLNVGSNAPPSYIPVTGTSAMVIPTLSEWGMIAMALLLAGTMVLAMRKKRA